MLCGVSVHYAELPAHLRHLMLRVVGLVTGHREVSEVDRGSVMDNCLDDTTLNINKMISPPTTSGLTLSAAYRIMFHEALKNFALNAHEDHTMKTVRVRGLPTKKSPAATEA